MANIVTTEKQIDGQTLKYEIKEDGYMIYLNDAPWIHQYEPYIPYPDLGYEESCLKQIEDLMTSNAPAEEESSEQDTTEIVE